MSVFSDKEIWFITGSQHLYGPETLQQVEKDSKVIAAALDDSPEIPGRLIFKEVVTTPDQILAACIQASATEACIGVITWMHTFSPAKMWIKGLLQLTKPILHLHTQMGRDIPWGQIDMDFMNLHQSAHGGREYGHIMSRLGKHREVVVGHWKDPEVVRKIGHWIRAARGIAETRSLRVARFGDNMREVSVTEGDKVGTQIDLGIEVSGYGVGDLVERVTAVTDAEVNRVVEKYRARYEDKSGHRVTQLRTAARIEAGLRAFLEEGRFGAFTTTFEDLHGLDQLPGMAVQQLMADGYGFGAEGDWKTAAMLRTVKRMGEGLAGGTSFMEDYTYHLDPAEPMVLGAHMLEVCPSIAAPGKKPSLEVHPLGIGGKDDPVRLVFDGAPGPAVNASLITLGGRLRLILNAVEAVNLPEAMPKLPVARVLWKPLPDLKTAAAAWILAGGAHHTVYTQAVPQSVLEMYGAMAGIETLVIDGETRLRDFKNELRWNDAAYARN
ncbi:L-arabinose isomerase [Spirochaeta lutea]|uniref:L-arabinose isomerase n=1 Tax=Spirochaeta lutea TaxID=1480694 RepID=A0A098R025_9SPIO|nr:L-arabinose isomerase [Spirochaeta lutea]KGE72082.1 arabinose isomerase [Spirochaeta lutea]